MTHVFEGNQFASMSAAFGPHEPGKGSIKWWDDGCTTIDSGNGTSISFRSNLERELADILGTMGTYRRDSQWLRDNGPEILRILRSTAPHPDADAYLKIVDTLKITTGKDWSLDMILKRISEAWINQENPDFAEVPDPTDPIEVLRSFVRNRRDLGDPEFRSMIDKLCDKAEGVIAFVEHRRKTRAPLEDAARPFAAYNDAATFPNSTWANASGDTAANTIDVKAPFPTIGNFRALAAALADAESLPVMGFDLLSTWFDKNPMTRQWADPGERITNFEELAVVTLQQQKEEIDRNLHWANFEIIPLLQTFRKIVEPLGLAGRHMTQGAMDPIPVPMDNGLTLQLGKRFFRAAVAAVADMETLFANNRRPNNE